jgi:hypothetical protein
VKRLVLFHFDSNSIRTYHSCSCYDTNAAPWDGGRGRGFSSTAIRRAHAGLPHTVRFLGRVEPLIDHPLDGARATMIV